MAMQTNATVHATTSPTAAPPPAHGNQDQAPTDRATVHVGMDQDDRNAAGGVDYAGRAQWLRAAVLGANDGLVSVASLMIGVGAVNKTPRAMLVSGLAGLVAGACSMAIGEFVSVYAQYDIEVAQLTRRRRGGEEEELKDKEERRRLPSPAKAAAASALAFAAGAVLPLLAGGFLRPWAARVAAVCAATTAALAGFGAVGAVLGGTSQAKSGARVLLGGWAAMAVSYAVLRLFSLAFGEQAVSAAA